MNMIVAVDSNWAIGNKNQLLVRIPADMKMFRNETTGKVVVLGRKTLETFPNAKPLPQRQNIILSTNPNYKVEGAIVVHNIDELMEEVKNYSSEEVYIIGGATVYEAMLSYVDTVFVTKIDHEYEADAWFPNLDTDPEWDVVAESEEQVYFDITYAFLRYERKSKA